MKNEKKQKKKKKQYEKPAVIYEGQITTRAGSPPGEEMNNPAVDPADLFGE